MIDSGLPAQTALRVQGALRRGWSWVLDYAYVGFWQVHGILVHYDADEYLRNVRPDAQPVLLIPGVYERWPFMRPVAERAHRLGHPVHVVEALGYNRGSVVRMAELVTDYLDEQDLRDVVIIAHSKGGLIGKYLLANDAGGAAVSAPGTDDGGAGKGAGTRVSAMLAINTPFSGSVYANFFLLPSIRAFSPRNKVLRGLTESRGVNSKITSVYSSWDPHIPGGSELAGARNVQLAGSGHFRIMADEELLDLVESLLL